MKIHEIRIEVTLELTDQDIDDLMVTALEGGINYWCGKAYPKLIPEGVDEGIFCSDLISKGGVVELTDAENEDEKWDLNLSKFLNGVKQYCEEYQISDEQNLMEMHDAETADHIIQYALFGELVFG